MLEKPPEEESGAWAERAKGASLAQLYAAPTGLPLA